MFSIFSLKDGISNVKGFFCDGVSFGMKPNGGLDVVLFAQRLHVIYQQHLPQIDFKHPQLNTTKGIQKILKPTFYL